MNRALTERLHWQPTSIPLGLRLTWLHKLLLFALPFKSPLRCLDIRFYYTGLSQSLYKLSLLPTLAYPSSGNNELIMRALCYRSRHCLELFSHCLPCSIHHLVVNDALVLGERYVTLYPPYDNSHRFNPNSI